MTKLVVFPNGRSPDKNCLECGMYSHCKHPYMKGEGSKNPTFMFVMEAPGAEEDERGIPAIGEAGLLLRESIEAVGIEMQDCRFSNSILCHPEGNNLKAWPKAAELCKPHILAEIKHRNPKVVVVIGAYAMKSLLDKTGVLKLHGEVFRMPDRVYVTMFHPAYLLRNNTPEMRLKFRRALQVAKEMGDSKKFKARTSEWIKLDHENVSRHLNSV